MVQSSAVDTVPMVVQLIPLMVGKLNETLHMGAATPEALEKRSELQGLLCGVVQVRRALDPESYPEAPGSRPLL